MKTIYKYDLFGYVGAQSIDTMIPGDARLLKVGVQQGRIVGWFLVNPSEPVTTRTFRLIGTGWWVQDDELDDFDYIDTVFDGEFVWHVWEQRRP